MKYVMGIDQGSSKTHVIIGDESGNIMGFGKSHGACHSSTGIDYAMHAISEAMQTALTQAKLGLDDIAVLAAGMTGVDWEFEYGLLQEKLEKLTGVPHVVVVNDCIIAMRAGSTHRYGAVLCAGSGLNCAVRNKNGKEFVYGFYIDEEYQGGSALGRACVRAVTDAYAGLEEETMLTEILLRKFSCKDVDELLLKKVTDRLTLQDYLSLPIDFEEAARLGDRTAKAILYRFGYQFGRYVSTALRRMEMLDYEVEVVLSGSIFKCREPELREGVEDYLKREAPLAKLVNAVYEPIVGAYLLAIEAAGNETTLAMCNIERNSLEFPLKRAV